MINTLANVMLMHDHDHTYYNKVNRDLWLHIKCTGRVVQNQLLIPQATIYQRLANMITNGGNNSQRLEATQKAFDVYRSCIDSATIESRGATPLLYLIRNRLGMYSKLIKRCMQSVYL